MKFVSLFAYALIALMVFTGTALAQNAADPALSDVAKQIFDAVMHGQWWAAAAAGVIMLCAVARKYMPAAWKEGTKGDIVGTVTAFLMAFAGALGTWAVAPGAVMSGAVLLTALMVGVAAIGVYTIVHKVAEWLVAWGKLPAWAVSLLKMVAFIVGSDAVAKAKAGGDAAVVANPAPGMAGTDGVIEVE